MWKPLQFLVDSMKVLNIHSFLSWYSIKGYSIKYENYYSSLIPRLTDGLNVIFEKQWHVVVCIRYTQKNENIAPNWEKYHASAVEKMHSLEFNHRSMTVLYLCSVCEKPMSYDALSLLIQKLSAALRSSALETSQLQTEKLLRYFLELRGELRNVKHNNLFDWRFSYNILQKAKLNKYTYIH